MAITLIVAAAADDDAITLSLSQIEGTTGGEKLDANEPDLSCQHVSLQRGCATLCGPHRRKTGEDVELACYRADERAIDPSERFADQANKWLSKIQQTWPGPLRGITRYSRQVVCNRRCVSNSRRQFAATSLGDLPPGDYLAVVVPEGDDSLDLYIDRSADGQSEQSIAADKLTRVWGKCEFTLDSPTAVRATVVGGADGSKFELRVDRVERSSQEPAARWR